MPAASSVTWGGYEWTGDFTTVDLIAMGFAFAIAFTFRVLALYRGWEEPLAKEPDGVVIHGEGGRSSAASTTASLSASCATSG